jgi:hypothetical protein
MRAMFLSSVQDKSDVSALWCCNGQAGYPTGAV